MYFAIVVINIRISQQKGPRKLVLILNSISTHPFTDLRATYGAF